MDQHISAILSYIFLILIPSFLMDQHNFMKKTKLSHGKKIKKVQLWKEVL